MGGYEQIRSEITLFKTAVQHGTYDYYHLLSGADLPLVSQQKIHDFFDQHSNRIFLQCMEKVDQQDIERVQHYHFFQSYHENHYPKTRVWPIRRLVMKCLRKIESSIQKCLRVNRLNEEIILKKGSQWCSLDHETVALILSKEKFVNQLTKYSICADEIFIQTLVHTYGLDDKIEVSQHKIEGIVGNNLRYIDWSRGTGASPYTWTDSMEDYHALRMAREQGYLWARKFDLVAFPNMQQFIEELVDFE